MQHEPTISGQGVHFRLLSIPVYVHTSFVLLVLLLGAPLLSDEPWLVLPLAGVVFVSVLWHELGHALAFRLQGRASAITLHVVGGHTMPADSPATAPLRELDCRAGRGADQHPASPIRLQVLEAAESVGHDPHRPRAGSRPLPVLPPGSSSPARGR